MYLILRLPYKYACFPEPGPRARTVSSSYECWVRQFVNSKKEKLIKSIINLSQVLLTIKTPLLKGSLFPFFSPFEGSCQARQTNCRNVFTVLFTLLQQQKSKKNMYHQSDYMNMTPRHPPYQKNKGYPSYAPTRDYTAYRSWQPWYPPADPPVASCASRQLLALGYGGTASHFLIIMFVIFDRGYLHHSKYWLNFDIIY